MELTKNQVWLGGGLTALLVSLAALAQIGCSGDDNSGGPAADAAASDSSMQQVEAGLDAGYDGPAPPLGVPVSSCNGCPVCAGGLQSPTVGFSYCTQDCDSSADCPTGLACVADKSVAALPNHCLRTCTSNTDCTAPFICRQDLLTPGSYCYSPFPTPGAPTPFPEAGTTANDSGIDAASDTGAPVDAGAPDSGSTDAGGDAADGG